MADIENAINLYCDETFTKLCKLKAEKMETYNRRLTKKIVTSEIYYLVHWGCIHGKPSKASTTDKNTKTLKMMCPFEMIYQFDRQSNTYCNVWVDTRTT